MLYWISPIGDHRIEKLFNPSSGYSEPTNTGYKVGQLTPNGMPVYSKEPYRHIFKQSQIIIHPLHVFGGLEETREPRANPSRHGVNMQKCPQI